MGENVFVSVAMVALKIRILGAPVGFPQHRTPRGGIPYTRVNAARRRRSNNRAKRSTSDPKGHRHSGD
jgi:hypothetical protein